MHSACPARGVAAGRDKTPDDRAGLRMQGQRSCLTYSFLRSPYGMRRFTTLPANLILVLLLTSCQSARPFEPLNEPWATAQLNAPPENLQKAEALHKSGFQLYKQKRDSEAIVQYEAALKLRASAGLYYDYANSLSNIDGRLEDSIRAYSYRRSFSPGASPRIQR